MQDDEPWRGLCSLLSPPTVRALVAEFVTRDTNEYGRARAHIGRFVEDEMLRLGSGEAKVVFDAGTGAVHRPETASAVSMAARKGARKTVDDCWTHVGR